ncbi:MAG: hypothetical protein HZLCBSQH_000304 [Candidatus Fervidibacterota bacterium]
MSVPDPTRKELLLVGKNGMETSVALAEAGNPFTGERFMRRATVRWFFERLNESGLPYALIGGLAVAHYATPRLTQDVDILVRDEDRPRLHQLFIANLVQATEDLSTFPFSGAKGDVFVAKLPHEQEAVVEAEQGAFEGVPVRVVRPRHLILLKLHAAWQRRIFPRAEQDRTDIADVLHHTRHQLTADDIRYIAERLRAYCQSPEGLTRWQEQITWLNRTLQQLGLTDWQFPLSESADDAPR